MPDVGVLELSIQDNSSQAAGGLEQLATALERVKNAVNFGRSIGDVARNVNNLGKALKDSISEDTITKLNRITDALSNLQGISNVTLNIKIQEGAQVAVDAVRDAVDHARESLEEFEKVNNALSTSVNMNWTRGYSQQFENMVNEFMRMRSAMALGSGQEMLRLTGGGVAPENMLSTYVSTSGAWKTDWDYASNWKPDWVSMAGRDTGGAIPVEGWVDGMQAAANASEGMLIVRNSIEEVANTVGDMHTVSSAVEDVAGASDDAANGMKTVEQSVEDMKESSGGLISTLRSVKDSLSDMEFSVGALSKAFKTMFPTLSNLISSFKRIAKTRMIRAVIKEITEGVSQGVENMYQYSKQVGSSFAPAMDSAAASLAQMKNSIGAALAPLLQSLIPILQTVVNWFITAVNYANQFLALMRGQSTWTRATLTSADAFDDVKKKASGAKNAIKDLLADWDELNIIQSESTSGSGTGTKGMEDYLSMFEEVGEFDQKIKNIVNFLKENMSTILTTAGAIGAAILGWKFSNAFAEMLPFLGKIGTGLSALGTIGITLAVTDITGNAFAETGNAGWLIADALTGAVGSTIAGELAAKVLGEKAGEVTRGFTLILSGIINIKNAVKAAEQKQKARAFILTALGSIETGIGAALAAAGFGAGATVSILTGVVTGVATLTIGIGLVIAAERRATYKQMAIDAFSESGENGIDPQKYIEALQTRLNELTAGSQLVVETSLGFDDANENFKKNLESLKSMNELISGNEKLTEEDAKAFKNAWDIIIKELGEISKITSETIFAGLDEAIAHGSESIKETALEYRKQMIEAEAIMHGARGKLEKEMEFLVNAISSGVASDEDIERYKTIYTVLAKETESGLDEFKKKLQDGAAFDFTGDKNPVDAAVAFIKQIGTDMIQPALDGVQAQYDAEIKAVKEQQKQLDQLYELNDIDDETYKKLSDLYSGQIALYAQRLEEQKREINEAVGDAYSIITNQAIKGYLSLDQNDDEALQSYIDNVFNPIIKALEEQGQQIPEELKTILARNGKSAVVADAAEMIRNSERTELYESFFKDMEAGNIEDVETFTIGYELDLVNQNPEKITDEVKKDIVNSMYEAFGGLPSMFEKLNEAFGWDFQDMLDMIDTSKLTSEELEDLQVTIDILKQSTGADLKLPKLENTDIKESANEAAEAIENLTKRIRSAFASLDGLKYQMNMFGSQSSGGFVVHIPQITPAANGGIFKSGDIFTANENGRSEMIGSFGNQTAVANNQQIVAGISSGVSQANAGVEARLGTIETMLNRILNKEFVAKAVPSSRWGEHGTRSSEQYSKVTGVY